MKRPAFVSAARQRAVEWYERAAELRADEEHTVVGCTIKLRPFTLPHDTDYDEAWNLLLAARSRVYFDIGCNKGWFALVAALVNPELQVVLVDASADVLAVAARQMLANGVDLRARYALGFVSDSVDDTVDFYTWGLAPSGSKHGDHLARKGVAPTQVRTTTVDRLAQDVGLVPDLVKVDVEGAEQEVLAGAVEVTASRRTSYLVEVHATGGMTMEENTTGVLAWCDANDMDAWYLRDHRRLTDPADTAQRGRCHVLLQPAGTSYPAGLDRLGQSASLEEVLPLLVKDRPAAEG